MIEVEVKEARLASMSLAFARRAKVPAGVNPITGAFGLSVGSLALRRDELPELPELLDVGPIRAVLIAMRRQPAGASQQVSHPYCHKRG